MLLPKKKNQGQIGSGNRFLIIVNVMGSAGPLRFVVKEEELVAGVIETALKSYAREGRLPSLGLNPDNCFLYCPNASGALSPWEPIGSSGSRNFILCKKAEQIDADCDAPSKSVQSRGSLKSWINKSLNRMVSSH